MYIALVVFFAVPLTMMFVAVLSLVTDVGGYGWTIYDRDIIIGSNLWKFSNNYPNSASLADAMTFLIMLHSTRTGTFSVGIYCICVLGFGPRKKYPLDLICASGSDL